MASDAAPAHPAPQGTVIYYWNSGLLMLARTLVVDRPFSPLGATLRLGCRRPYTIEVGEQTLRTRASLLAPGAGRRRIEAVDSDIAVFYLPIEAPEHAGLATLLGDQPVVDLDFRPFEPLLPQLQAAHEGRLDPAAVRPLVRAVVQATTGRPAPERRLDPRIAQVVARLQALPLRDFQLEPLAAEVQLSPSRLRELFRAQTGSPISQYARWQSVWRAVRLWQDGLRLTDLALEAGFHDLAHMNRAFVETFGINPLSAVDTRYVRLIRCE